MKPTLTVEHIESIASDGLVVIESRFEAATVMGARFEPLFAGRFETGLLAVESQDRREQQEPPVSIEDSQQSTSADAISTSPAHLRLAKAGARA